MADQASIQARVDFGYGKAAQYLGASYQWYRPTSASNPIIAANLLGSIQAHFDPSFSFDAKRPQLYNKPVWGCAVDRTNLQVGDYLDGALGTFFIAAMQPLLPTATVLCNATLTIYRPGGQQAVGNAYYGGNPQGYGTPVLTAWPASVLNGTKGETSQSGVMADTRQQWFAVLLPDALDIEIKANDLIVDQEGRRMTISAVEQTGLGLRITSQFSGS